MAVRLKCSNCLSNLGMLPCYKSGTVNITKLSTKEIVEQIHKEFNTYSDILLKDAQEIISSTN